METSWIINGEEIYIHVILMCLSGTYSILCIYVVASGECTVAVFNGFLERSGFLFF